MKWLKLNLDSSINFFVLFLIERGVDNLIHNQFHLFNLTPSIESIKSNFNLITRMRSVTITF